MKTTHTPGPWTVAQPSEQAVIITDANGHHVLTVTTNSWLSVYQNAEALLSERDRLKAINDDLVAALEGLMTPFGGTVGCMKDDDRSIAARQAIQRAKG